MINVDTTKLLREQSHKSISSDTTITSKKIGFEYLNELFIKRHHKILWKSTKYISIVCLCLFAVIIYLIQIFSEVKTEVNGLLMNSLPYFLFIMYAINRGMSYTQCLFVNCDHSLLTYSFYKKPKFILDLFKFNLILT